MRSEDPELKPIFDEIRSGGMAAMMKVGRGPHGRVLLGRALAGPAWVSQPPRNAALGECKSSQPRLPCDCRAHFLPPRPRSSPAAAVHERPHLPVGEQPAPRAIGEQHHGKGGVLHGVPAAKPVALLPGCRMLHMAPLQSLSLPLLPLPCVPGRKSEPRWAMWWMQRPPPLRRRRRRRSTTSWMQPSELACVMPLNCEGQLVGSCWTSQSLGHGGSEQSRLGSNRHKTWVHWPGGSRSFLSSCVHNPPVLFANRAGDLEAIEDYMAIGKGDLKDGEGRGALHYAVSGTVGKGGRQAAGRGRNVEACGTAVAARQRKHCTWACMLRSSIIGSQVLPATHPTSLPSHFAGGLQPGARSAGAAGQWGGHIGAGQHWEPAAALRRWVRLLWAGPWLGAGGSSAYGTQSGGGGKGGSSPTAPAPWAYTSAGNPPASLCQCTLPSQSCFSSAA